MSTEKKKASQKKSNKPPIKVIVNGNRFTTSPDYLHQVKSVLKESVPGVKRIKVDGPTDTRYACRAEFLLTFYKGCRPKPKGFWKSEAGLLTRATLESFCFNRISSVSRIKKKDLSSD